MADAFDGLHVLTNTSVESKKMRYTGDASNLERGNPRHASPPTRDNEKAARCNDPCNSVPPVIILNTSDV